MVKFYYGRKGGGAFVTGCDAIDAVMQIDEPKLFKMVQADGDGVAELRAFIPPNGSTIKGVLIQAVDEANCQESQLVVKKIE